MKKRIPLLVLFSFCTYIYSFAQQNWREMMYDPSKNFYDIQAAFYEGCGDLPCDSAPGYKQFKRWEAHMVDRVYPTGVYDAETVFNEFLNVYYYNTHQYNAPFAPMVMAPSSAAASTTEWEFVGPIDNPKTYDHPSVTNRNGIGRVNTIAFHPTNANIIYVGSPTGGIWKTTDGGSTWTVLSDFITNLGVSDIAIQNSNPNVIYWVTGDYDGGDTFFSKILKSTNGGTSWTVLNGSGLPSGTNRVISRILIHPIVSNILIVSTSSGIYRSTDGGVSWSQRQSGNFSSLEFKPGNHNIVYAGTRLNGRVYRSTDNGVSWSLVHQSSGGYRTALAVTPNNANVVYATFSNSSSQYQNSAKSTNSGANWSNMAGLPNAINGIGQQCDYNFCVAAASDDANFVHIGAVNLYRSTNGGSSWSQPYSDINTHVDYHTLRYNPLDNKLYAGHDGGISVSSDDSYNWSYISDGLNITQFYNFGVSQSNSGLDVLFAGAQDNSLLYKNNNGWFRAVAGDGVNSKIHKDNENIMIGSVQYGIAMLKSATSSPPFSDITPEGQSGTGLWELPFEMDPNNNDIVYAGYRKLFKSTNSGGSWTVVAGTNVTSNEVINQICPTTNPNIIYFSTRNSSGSKLFKTTNGGSSWAQIGVGALPDLIITDIATPDSDPNTVWVTFSGTSASNKVFRSTNGGTSWSNRSGTLPNIPVNCIILDENVEEVYAGLDFGVYKLPSYTSTTWSLFNNNSLPYVYVKELEIHKTSAQLVAGTFGRGIWKIDLKHKPIVEFSADQTTVCQNEAVNFTDESLHNPTSWLWNFGDGNTSNEQHPTHSYSSGGTFNVTLTATNANGSISETYSNYITVVPLAGNPVSNITTSGSYEWFGTTYFCTGTYYYTSPTCQDYTLNLTINNPLISSTSVTACDEYTWDVSGQLYTTSGTYYQSVLAPQGCFADKELVLTINASTESSTSHSATYSYTWHGENYFCSGTYYHYSTNAAGCVHTDILYLNIE
ncbi:MAG: PKD domain-containing protein [Flavobacteriales bacterium]|nr:PKD domain-containing protein [Flavobacteriales bacterium]